MSIASDAKVRDLEARVEALEKKEPIDLGKILEMIEKIWGEIKTIKMRMARNDGKRTSSPD